MKKLLALILVLVFTCMFIASCEYLPEELTDKLNPILDKLGLSQDESPDGPGDDIVSDAPHEHNFVIDAEASKAATCSRDGLTKYTCSCGETKEEVEKATGHDYSPASITPPTCNREGSTKLKCTKCGYSITEKTPATGHSFAAFVEYSRLVPCQNEFCSYAKFYEGENKYKEVIVFKFSDEDIDKFEAIYAQLDEIISSAAKYDPALHAYEEGSETEAAYLVMEAKYDELYEVLEYVTAQYQIAQIEYHQTMNDADQEKYNHISEVRTDLVADFYSFSEAIYKSMFRDYYYYGMTEEEIKAFIFDSNAVSNPEYKALVDRNNAIELEFLEITDPASSDLVPTLYYEFVSNNKKIARLMGYDNYLEYAYENVYDRDYSYEDVSVIYENVKKYISSIYSKLYSKWGTITGPSMTNDALMTYYTYCEESFFTNYESNKQLNDYIDLMVFTSNPDKQISFSDSFNGLMGDGNLFRGRYNGAYVTSLYGMDIPIAYFGSGSYSSSFTVAHEFGHYMNEVYGGGKYSQSFDLLEMHSQGNEMLYLTYLKNLEGLSADGVEIVETYQLLVMLDTIMNALAVDTFEQAVYTNVYAGPNADKIMADGEITADEYDLLYKSIIEDLGASSYMSGSYWRYMTITSPCYYISYSVSALSVLQLYPMANEDFDAAKDAYLKLFTYVDEYETDDTYMTTEETLEYAGLYSFTDPNLYKYISRFFASFFA